MNTAQVLFVFAAAALLAAEGRVLLAAVDDDVLAPAVGVLGVEESAAPHPFAPEALEPTVPLEEDETVVAEAVAVPPRVRRSTTVFRPLFVTREREAERQEARERRREYWVREEQRRRSAQVQPQQQHYPAQYRPYPAGYPAGR